MTQAIDLRDFKQGPQRNLVEVRMEVGQEVTLECRDCSAVRRLHEDATPEEIRSNVDEHEAAHDREWERVTARRPLTCSCGAAAWFLEGAVCLSVSGELTSAGMDPRCASCGDTYSDFPEDSTSPFRP